MVLLFFFFPFASFTVILGFEVHDIEKHCTNRGGDMMSLTVTTIDD